MNSFGAKFLERRQTQLILLADNISYAISEKLAILPSSISPSSPSPTSNPLDGHAVHHLLLLNYAGLASYLSLANPQSKLKFISILSINTHGMPVRDKGSVLGTRNWWKVLNQTLFSLSNQGRQWFIQKKNKPTRSNSVQTKPPNLYVIRTIK